MSMDLTGIINRNEYYTNHYFSTMFEDGASERIKQWAEESKNQEAKTPWAMLRENARQYYPIQDRYNRGQPHLTTAANIISMATQYLNSLGYGALNSASISIDKDLSVPIFHEETKANKAPALWVVLAYSKDKTSGIMESSILDFNAVNNDKLIPTNDNIEALATKLLFHTTESPRFLIVIGIDTIVLIDRNKWNNKCYLEFDLQEIFSRHEVTTLQAMSVLLHKDSLCPSDGNSLIDALDEQSRKHSSGVSQDLKYALRESIEMLGNEVIYDMKNRQGKDLDAEPVDATQLTVECLRYMYRMLFVLFIEARSNLGYAPMNVPVYAKGYSLESLRDIAETVRNDTDKVGEGFYLFETLSKLYELIYTGYPKKESVYNKVKNLDSVHDIFVIPPLKAHIFDPEYTPLLVNAKIRNCVMLRIIDLMSVTKSTSKKGSRRGRISYANLGINQMGAIYEALLSYRGFIAEQDLYEVKKAGDNFNELDVGYFVTAQELDQYTEEERVRYESGEKKGQLRVHLKGEFIYRLAGREREKSASYYTPESLTKCLVKYALKELLKDKTADEILSLTVCEPAMGSAAFLNEAINQLAEAYIERKQEELGETISHEKRMDELQKVKMYIADNNVYGIDLNPVAVELAEVSLWLNTIYKGGYVPWFGTQLVNGNSLIGARRQVYHKSQLLTSVKGLRWYENAPERISFVKNDSNERKNARSSSQVYHFLTGDPGMCNYTDKVIKSLEPEKIAAMKAWNKKFTAAYTEDEFNILIELSKLIDGLWKEQIDARKDLKKYTITALDVYGHKDTRPDYGHSIREKDKLLRGTYKTENAKNAKSYARLKFAMDYWCALWFWPISKADLLPSRSEFLFEMTLILRGTMETTTQNNQSSFIDPDTKEEVLIQSVDINLLCNLFPRLALVRQIANENKFMHWELEFADVFKDRGGFDLIIGNPPWVKLTWTEQNVLSDKNPMFAVKKLSATQTVQRRNEALADIQTNKVYFSEYESLSGQQAFFNAVQNYLELKGQQTNLYKCFLPLAYRIMSECGVSAFIHPEGIFNDPTGDELRKITYPRMKTHFRFSNALKLFADVHTSRDFGLNVYSNSLNESFVQIVDLYDPKTIDECFTNDSNKPIYMRNENGKRNTSGQRNRITTIGQNELKLFSTLLGKADNWRSTKLMNLYTEPLIKVLTLFSKCSTSLSHISDVYSTQLWQETNSQNDETIRKESHFGTPIETVLSGALIGTANPLFNCLNATCSGNNDNTTVDLTLIPEDYVQRSNYIPNCDITEYYEKSPKTQWDEYYLNTYRIVARKMIDIEGERTLMPSLLPPKIAHTNGIIGFCFKNSKHLTTMLGLMTSLPYDFFIKAIGKGNLYMESAGMLPLFTEDSPIINEVICRVLMLNCLTKYYSALWNESFTSLFSSYEWSKTDARLSNTVFSQLSSDWTWKTPLRTDYARRQAMIEIDVLSSMLLGMTLDDLLMIYRVQFPILQQHEDETYYDTNGRIVYAKNNALKNVGFDTNEWEGNVKGAPAGKVFTKEIEDDTMPGGPVKRTIEYVAPFDKCDREQDYETAWKFFEEKYRKSDD